MNSGRPAVLVASSLGRRSADLKDEEEDVNDVHVEGKSSEDVLLRADGQLPVPDEKLSVVDQKLKRGEETVTRREQRSV